LVQRGKSSRKSFLLVYEDVVINITNYHHRRRSLMAVDSC
jgi:hypothetical protein